MVTIIGAGWYGCYIASKLIEKDIKFEILEKNSEIFKGSSGFNQNRLHQGFHYPMDYNTRNTSKIGFEKFLKVFPGLSHKFTNNLYAIHKNSNIDFETYLSIYSHEKINFELCRLEQYKDFKNYKGIISVTEQLIDFKKSKEFFLSMNLPIKYNTTCEYKSDNIYANNKRISSDLIFDCTYGQLKTPLGFFNENFISFIYKKNKNTLFEALTVMNGPFYSIYPYFDDLYTVTGVFEGVISEKEFKLYGKEKYVQEKRKLLEDKISKDYDLFLNDFSYINHFISMKTKPFSQTDSRSTFLFKKDKIITVSSGKIDTIFELDSFLDKLF